jgi:hypothetical protein
VRADEKIVDFIEKAIAAGIPQESLIGILAAQGWPEKEIYNALADHYRRVTGIEAPRRTGTGASAKEAFFYLLIFATLATWTIGFANLAFALIDQWIADPLFNGFQQSVDSYTMSWSLAALIVAFPLYLLISRAAHRETIEHPEKLDSPVRRWLTYMALVIAAGVFMGDLINALNFLLRGELTSRFLAKTFVVLALSGGIFFYYYGGLRRNETSSAGNRSDRLLAGLCSALVALLIVLGFMQLGLPRKQRELRADQQRVFHLYQLSMQVREYWTSHDSQLPTSMAELPGKREMDPVTHAAYEYRPGQGSGFQLCATFSRNSDREDGLNADQWIHSAGHYCFSLDARASAQFPGMYTGR